ncbi:MAG: hypothetical protein ABIQ07_03990 [Ginsengibacter sp.]
MSIAITFAPSGMSTAKYDECIQKLNAAGAGSPKGRSYHVCYGDSDSVQVSDVWDSIEEFQAFGNTLMPILHSLGIDPGQPTPMPVHNIIEG